MDEAFPGVSSNQNYNLPKLTLQSVGPQVGVDEEVDIYLGDKQVGVVELSAEAAIGKVMIWNFRISEDFRGKGYGKAARAMLIPHILNTYDDWVKTIYSSMDKIPALKSAISTKVPDGWMRSFKLFAPTPDGGDSAEIKTTTDPEEAKQWLEIHEQDIKNEQLFSVGVEYIKKDEP